MLWEWQTFLRLQESKCIIYIYFLFLSLLLRCWKGTTPVLQTLSEREPVRNGDLSYKSPHTGDPSPVWVSLRVERAHVVDLLEVDVGEHQLVVGGVNDGGPVGAGKHVGGGQWVEGAQHCRLGAQGHLLALAQQAFERPHTQKHKSNKYTKLWVFHGSSVQTVVKYEEGGVGRHYSRLVSMDECWNFNLFLFWN